LRSGYRDEDIREVAVTRVAENVIAITSTAELKDGEYLISVGNHEAGTGYDFGVVNEK
jgi:hypothetical protein